MSIEFTFRLLGMVVFSVVGAYLGVYISDAMATPPEAMGILLGLLGALFGLIMTPFLTTRPIRAMRASLMQLSAQSLTAGMAGLIVGLIIAALLSFP